jgi:hypothetical protein
VHVVVEIVQIRIVFYIFKMRGPVKMFSQNFRQRGFACTDITCNCDVLDGLFFGHGMNGA